MICLHCGYCCKNYFVVIVDDPKKGPIESNLKTHIGDGTPCQHLVGDKPGEYRCLVHEESWYKDTPCARHGQIEKDPETPCRVGVHWIERYKS